MLQGWKNSAVISFLKKETLAQAAYKLEISGPADVSIKRDSKRSGFVRRHQEKSELKDSAKRYENANYRSAAAPDCAHTARFSTESYEFVSGPGRIRDKAAARGLKRREGD